MAHAITIRKSGKAEMAYTGQKPWHGLGEQMPEGRPIEEWLTAAGMDWTIQRSKVRYATERDGPLVEWPDYEVLIRSDTKAPLGMVSDQFKVVQPRAALEFFRDLVEVAGFKIETAGTLFGGSRFWALASIGAEDRIVGNDLIKGRLLFASANDTSMKTKVKNIIERVVCANTLAIAMGERGAPEVSVSHRTKFDEAKVKAQLGIAVTSFERFVKEAREFAKRDVSKVEAEAFVAKVLNVAEVEAAKEQRAFDRILTLFRVSGHGALLPGVKSTAWGLVNAVTEYVDHDRPTKGANADSNRMNSAWFGSGSAMKDRAVAAARELVTV